MSMEKSDKYSLSLQFQKLMLEKPKETDSNDCEHEYQKFRQNIMPDNNKFLGIAYYIVKGCPKCKDKKILDMKVEV